MNSWMYRAATDAERDRLGWLAKPPAQNPARLMRLVRVRAIEGFAIGYGQTAVPGDVVSIPFYVAHDLCALGRAQWLNEEGAQRS